jgi:hypothetical protein
MGDSSSNKNSPVLTPRLTKIIIKFFAEKLFERSSGSAHGPSIAFFKSMESFAFRISQKNSNNQEKSEVSGAGLFSVERISDFPK